MPRLSIVIPALGAWEQLEATLVSVLANRPADAEIFVALGRGYDDPYEIEGEVRFVSLPPGATAVDAWNEAFVACRAPVVHLLACGAIVTEGWTDAALSHFDDPRVAAVAPIITSVDERIVHTAGWQYSLGGVANNFAAGQPTDAVSETNRRWIGPHGAAAFYRRSALTPSRAAFDPSLGEELAPLDVGLRLRTAGYRAILEPRSRVAIAEIAGGAARDNLPSEKLFWRHAASDGAWQAAVAHVGAIAGEFARTFPQPRCVRQLWQRARGLLSSPWSADAGFELEPYADAQKTDGACPSRRFHQPHGTGVRPATRSANVAGGWPS
ncbi:MAG TPA: glycosyltransferase family 2 protein [Pirellulales bacterium]|nr:glycosyltransferase family 2 protein [Pirellulales bacterium]